MSSLTLNGRCRVSPLCSTGAGKLYSLGLTEAARPAVAGQTEPSQVLLRGLVPFNQLRHCEHSLPNQHGEISHSFCLDSYCPCMGPYCPCLDSYCPCMGPYCPCLDSYCPCMGSYCPCLDSYCPCMGSYCPCLDSYCPCMGSYCPLPGLLLPLYGALLPLYGVLLPLYAVLLPLYGVYMALLLKSGSVLMKLTVGVACCKCSSRAVITQ